MTRDYTDQEIQDAVAKLVRSSVRRTYGALANRRTDLSFGDIQDAAAGVFLNYPSAPYYVVALARDVLLEKSETLEKTLADLTDTVRSTGRRTRPVEGLSSLANARSALGALSSATAARDKAFTRIDDVPAYQRFEQSTARFLADEGASIRSSGAVVQTAEEARSRLAGLVDALVEQYTEVIERAQYVSSALEDFDGLQLGARLANYVIANAESSLGGWYDSLSQLSPKERTTKLRDVVLDVLAARATVKGFGSLAPSTSYLYFNGPGAPYADVNYPCTSANLLSDNGGPYTILDDTGLNLLVDGVYPITVDVPSSYVAALEGYLVEPFDISATPGLENNKLFFDVTGSARLTATLVPNAAKTAQAVADDINAAVTTEPLLAEPYGPQLYLRGEPVLIDLVGGAVAGFERTPDIYLNPRDWPTVALGDWVLVSDSIAGNDGWYQVTDVSGLPLRFEASKESGTPADELGATAVADLNRAGRALRVTIAAASRQVAVDGRWSLGALADDDIVSRAQQRLGLPYGATLTCEPTPTASVVSFINGNPSVAPGGVPRMRASAQFEPTLTGPARSEPTDGTLVVFTELRTTCDITAAGTNVTFGNFGEDPTGVGAVIVIRVTGQVGQVDNWGTITSNTGGVVQATMYAPVPTTEVGVEVEFCPDLSLATFPAVLRVENTPPSVNDGVYEARGLDGKVTLLDPSRPPVALVLSRSLVSYASTGNTPVYFQATYGRDFLMLTSLSVLTNSALEVLGSSPAGSIFWDTLPISVVGTSRYFGLASPPLKVEVGDYLELNSTSAQATVLRYEVLRVLSSPSLLELDTELDVNAGSWSMEQGAPAPWGRVKKRRHDNYSVLKDALDVWLRSADVERYLAGFRRLLNPILVNNNPTASAIGDAVSYLYALQTQLASLQGVLVAYVAARVEQVDTLLATYVQQGAQRAVDTLVQARFSAFFGLDQDDASYPGAVQKAMRAVQAEDLPQNKLRRRKAVELIDSYEEPDFEFDTSDTDGLPDDPSPPGDAYEYGGGSAI